MKIKKKTSIKPKTKKHHGEESVQGVTCGGTRVLPHPKKCPLEHPAKR